MSEQSEVHMVRLTMAVASHLPSPEATADAIVAALQANKPAGLDRVVALVECEHGDNVGAGETERPEAATLAVFGRKGGRHVRA